MSAHNTLSDKDETGKPKLPQNWSIKSAVNKPGLAVPSPLA
jgi:hypothetical protein